MHYKKITCTYPQAQIDDGLLAYLQSVPIKYVLIDIQSSALLMVYNRGL